MMTSGTVMEESVLTPVMRVMTPLPSTESGGPSTGEGGPADVIDDWDTWYVTWNKNYLVFIKNQKSIFTIRKS